MTSVTDNVRVVNTLGPVTSQSADTTRSSIDLLDATSVLLHVRVGSTIDDADGDETYTIRLQDSADNSSFSDLQTDGSNNDEISLTRGSKNTDYFMRIDHLQNVRRYLRAKLITGGTTPSISFDANFIAFTYDNPQTSPDAETV